MRKSILIALFLSLLLFSCKSVKHETFFFVSVHLPVTSSEVIPTTMLMPLQDSQTGRVHYLRRLPVFSSADIEAIEMVEDKDGIHYRLKFYLDSVSNAKIQEALHYHRGEKLCVVVDGFFTGFTEFEAVKDEPSAILTGDALWNKAEAQLIIENVEHNYKLKGNRSNLKW